jgi:hypothetical protein
MDASYSALNPGVNPGVTPLLATRMSGVALERLVLKPEVLAAIRFGVFSVPAPAPWPQAAG